MGKVDIEERVYRAAHDLVYEKGHPFFKNITQLVEWSTEYVLNRINKGEDVLQNPTPRLAKQDNNVPAFWKLAIFFTIVIVLSNIISVIVVLNFGG